MICKKYIITASILLFGVGSPAFSQSKTEPDDVIVSASHVFQAPATPVAPQTWNFTVGGDSNFLGVSTETVTPENQAAYGLHDARGVGVNRIIKDSPAEKAGLQKDDVILRFDNEPVTSIRKLNRLIEESEPNHTAQLTISRHGVEQQIAVKLGKRSDSTARLLQSVPPKWDDDLVKPFGKDGNFQFDPKDFPKMYQVFGSSRRIGVSTTPLTKQLGEYFGVKDGGVLVSSVNEGSPAAKAGIKAGDVVIEVDGTKINSAAELIQELGKKKEGDVTLTIIRDRTQRSVRVTPDAASNPADFRVLDWPQVGEIVIPKFKPASIPKIKTLGAPNNKALPLITIPKLEILTLPDVPGQIL